MFIIMYALLLFIIGNINNNNNNSNNCKIYEYWEIDCNKIEELKINCGCFKCQFYLDQDEA